MAIIDRYDLIEEVAKKTGMSRRDVDNILSTFIVTLQSELKSDKKYVQPRFGKFYLEKQSKRYARDKDGNAVIIPAKEVPDFIPSKVLLRKLNLKSKKENKNNIDDSDFASEFNSDTNEINNNEDNSDIKSDLNSDINEKEQN